MFNRKFKVASLVVLLLMFTALTAAENRAKYVFLFVGDGMGENIRKYYQHEFPDSCLESFPVTVHNGTNNVGGTVTDSAASGTAIACGIKTYNSAIGVNAKQQPVTSLAKIMRDNNFSIAIITSVGIQDATPSAHYANRVYRKDYAGIVSDLYASNFDFFAGGAIAFGKDYTVDKYKKLLKQVNYDYIDKLEFNEKTPRKRVVFVNAMHPDWPDTPQPRHLLSEVTDFAIKSLSDNPKGFFMLIEGGAIDHRAHNNDLAGVMREMREFDMAVKTALEFQKKHPADTLIVVTSDHDTGGMNIKEYKDSSLWKKQLNTSGKATGKFAEELAKAPADEVIKLLANYFGMENMTAEETKIMQQAIAEFRDPASRTRDLKRFRSMYGSYNPVLVNMMRLRDARCGIDWQSFSHTDRKVLTNASGAGAEYFKNVKENSDISHAISMAVFGKDVMTRAANTLPFPVEKKSEEYFNFISMNTSKAIFRYGQKKAEALEFVFSGSGKNETVKRNDRAGRITITNLAANTAYTMQVKRNGKVIAKCDIKTPAVPAGKLLLKAGIIADSHLSLAPDVRYGRLHSKSEAAMTNACKKFVEDKVDFIALPGDVTDASRPHETTAVSQIIQKFKGTKFYAVPGNHDLMNNAKFKPEWLKIFGKTARVEKHGKLQVLLLDTFNGVLTDKPENIEAVNALDPALPVLVFSHYQLTPDACLKDAKKAISDGDKAAEILKKLANMKGAIIVGHKNVATTAKLGNLIQINAPQLTQFPAGSLYAEIYSDGMRLEFRPAFDEFFDEYSRIRSNASKLTSARRDQNSLTVWNAFYPADFSAALEK